MATATLSQASAVKNVPAPLYQPLDCVMVRSPLLPIQSFLALTETPGREVIRDARVRRAIAVASGSLLGAMDRYEKAGLTQRDAERMRAKLLRYQIRMSTRPTPFGLFAGVALVRWGNKTDLTLRSTCARIRTRPDMSWLMQLVFSTEANLAVRKQLRFVTNPLVTVGRERIYLPEGAPSSKAASGTPVSARGTAVVKEALRLACKPIAYQDLLARLTASSPQATVEKVEKLIDELWEQTFLLTDLRPPLTTSSPARYVAEVLARIPEAAESFSRLESLLAALEAWDSLEAEPAVDRFSVLTESLAGADQAQDTTPIQVDMSMSMEGRVGEAVGSEAARAAELLLRLSPSPKGMSTLAAYRQAYISRYGHERQVPLLELLDARRGLGPPSRFGHAPVGPEPAKAAERAQTLLQMACAALNRHERVVALSEATLDRLETWRPDARTAPLSLDINFLLAARSTDAIDQGDFMVIVGPNLGATAAGRNLGRFADLIGSDALTVLEQAAVQESIHRENCICAEIVWLPSNLRSANVVVRPRIRSHEVALGVTASVSDSEVIPLDELLVGVEQGRFVVRWPAAGKAVVFSSGHMLNQHTAPAVARFLLDLSNDGNAMFSSFDWGPAEAFPYLPRVQTGRVVLRPAQWRVRKADGIEENRGALKRWRAEWDAPRYVCLSVGDNRLILDLDDGSQAAELQNEVKKLTDGGSVIVQEVLPAFEDTWLCGPDGRYCSEFVASLVLRREDTELRQRDGDGASRTIGKKTDVARLIEEPLRLHPPGSGWLFLKLYGPRENEDEILSQHLPSFADRAVASGLADSWFFIRYSDPDPHLRIRFRGAPEQLSGSLFGHVCDWAGGLVSDDLAAKFVFDSYEQEVERFGGAAGMEAAEALFFVDSRSTAELLRCSKAKDWAHDLTTLLVLSVENLLECLGLDRAGQLLWCRTHATNGGPDIGAEYRQRKNLLRALLGDPTYLPSQPGGTEVERALAATRSALIPIAQQFRRLKEELTLSESLETMCSSFVHLHINRLAGSSILEQRILSLLLRTQDSLEKAPWVKK